MPAIPNIWIYSKGFTPDLPKKNLLTCLVILHQQVGRVHLPIFRFHVGVEEGFIPLYPDFVVELCSKTDILKDLRVKMQEYMDNDARLGWLLDPKNKRVEIYQVGQAVEVLECPEKLSGEDVLLDFTLTLKRIWA